MELFIEKDSNNIFDREGNIVGEQRGKQVKLAPFANAPLKVSNYPQGYQIDAEEWPIMYQGKTLDIARERQYYECYLGLFIIADDNDLRLCRCGIHLKKETFESLDPDSNLLVTLEER